MASSNTDAVTTVANHWWWRPGWRVGRHYYACHFTLEDQPELRELIRHYQDAVSQLINLDIIPARWLHLTMQGIGFTDVISPADLDAVTACLKEQLQELHPPTVTFSQPTIEREAVYLKAVPTKPIYELRRHAYHVTASVLSRSQFSEALAGPNDYTPHVSIAYVNSDGPAKPIVDALSNVELQPITATFKSLPLLIFHRDHQMYEWTQVKTLPIGSSKATQSYP